ncbi:MAG: VOC family protein [Pseudomonadota bacterium]
MGTTHGTVHWSELMTRDVAASRAYYEAVCGWVWEVAEMPEGPYHLAMAHGQPVAGMMDMTGMPEFEGVPAHWFTYLAVDDIDAALAAVTAKGGEVMRPTFDVPEVGSIAIVRDAGGAALGLMKPTPTWEGAEGDAAVMENAPV